MESYFIKAVDASGKTVEEYREAVNERSLIKELQKEGYIPIRVSSSSSFSLQLFKRGAKTKQDVTRKEILLFTRELSSLLHSGLPLDRALLVLLDVSEDSPKLCRMIDMILEQVKEGENFSDALEARGKVFSRFYINMIRAGEVGGNLEEVLDRLTEYLESSQELRNTVTSALIYPAILLTISVLSIFLLLTFVIPQFTEMFESAGKELPLPTQIVVGISEWLQNYWWSLLLLFIFSVYFFKYFVSSPLRKREFDRRVLTIPLVGDIIRNMETANLCRTLGTLILNGVPLLGGLAIAKGTVSNSWLESILENAEGSLKDGQGLSKSLIESGQFPKMAVQMIKMGEESGKLEEMLIQVANTFDKELRITIQRMLALLEPALILGLGVMIAGIITSILMAILSVNDLAF